MDAGNCECFEENIEIEKEKWKIPNVCVATVTYNSKEYLLKILYALSKPTHQINIAYFEDGTMEMLNGALLLMRISNLNF